MAYQPPQKRPTRKGAGDRITNPSVHKAQIQIDYGIAPMDRLATQMEMTWGVDVLPTLVPPEMAAKYGAAMAHLNACIEADDVNGTAAAAGNCMRGLEAMDAKARETGMPSPEALAFGEVDGFKFGIIKGAGDWTAVKNENGHRLFSLREVGLALNAYLNTPLVAATKAAFPNSQVTRIKRNRNLEDAIPF